MLDSTLKAHRLAAVHADLGCKTLNARVAGAANLPFAFGVSRFAVFDLDWIAGQTRRRAGTSKQREIRIVGLTEDRREQRHCDCGGAFTEASHVFEPLGTSVRGSPPGHSHGSRLSGRTMRPTRDSWEREFRSARAVRARPRPGSERARTRPRTPIGPARSKPQIYGRFVAVEPGKGTRRRPQVFAGEDFSHASRIPMGRLELDGIRGGGLRSIGRADRRSGGIAGRGRVCGRADRRGRILSEAVRPSRRACPERGPLGRVEGPVLSERRQERSAGGQAPWRAAERSACSRTRASRLRAGRWFSTSSLNA